MSSVTFGILMLMLPSAAYARVTEIVIDDTQPLRIGTPAVDVPGYRQISGRAFGELDPNEPLNALIQDIELARDPDGKVRYVASFVLTVPTDLTNASGMLWHDVPNRGTPLLIGAAERAFGDIGLASAWQGDNSASNASNGTAVRPTQMVGDRHWLQVPIARNADGSPVTGLVLGRIVNRDGLAAQPLIVQTNPLPYLPASLDTTLATLVSRDGETMDGAAIGEQPIESSAWKFCGGGTFDDPQPLTTIPVNICLKNGFDATKLYQVVYTAKDPYVLGVGFAAWRDVGSFFKNQAQDDLGTPNPIAGIARWSIARGSSQSGNFLRGWLHLGFNQDESGRQVHDGMWPIIAGRRIALNFRWAQPDGVLELYQAGSEGPQWWSDFPDEVRGLPTNGILGRCRSSGTCPKIIEHFGSAEVWALKLTPEWVGTSGSTDIPLPANVRRYYIPSTTHGGTTLAAPTTMFNASLPGSLLPAASCPGNNYGTGILSANPLPHADTVNALLVHFRNWVINDVAPPPSRYPRLSDGNLVAAEKGAMGFPTIPLSIAGPGWRTTVPEPGFINPVLDYDWGPAFDPNDATGIPAQFPPPIKRVIKMLVPRVDADGNELGGVPLVLNDAPLGTYLGWNITDGRTSPPLAQYRPFHGGQLCDYVGGMIPFARTKAERLGSGDPRLSLEERYTDHGGYVAAVRKAAANAVAQGFLLQPGAAALISQADESNVLK
ncbi:MAG TPA: alpha/beta hydrolase domain-containing protein [Chloroflexota bacterium]|nr:alpha/beta hydrolase domain-containing protein [Chloroflexota bacterium]